MKTKLSLDIGFLKNNGACETANEICQQPEMWLKTRDLIKEQELKILSFLKPVLEKSGVEIILTGAGTSAFIGDTAEGILQKKLAVPTRSIATTDIVTHPELFIPANKPVLLVSFARSGNSPESVKTVELAESLSDQIYHLIITCNKDGYLAKQAPLKSYVVLLPEETNDKSLAMTSSFSSMLAAVFMITDLVGNNDFSAQIEIAAKYADFVLENMTTMIREIAGLDFNRAIFLGSGPMLGIAREGHLKLQELTDGKVICKFDSFLGFRHGPRAVIDDKSIIVYFFSGNDYVTKYEKDLVCSVEESRKGLLRLGLMEYDIPGIPLRNKIIYSDRRQLDEAYLALSHIVPVQMLGFFKSLQSGHSPDSPSKSGVISRVVQGVTLYRYNGEK